MVKKKSLEEILNETQPTDIFEMEEVETAIKTLYNRKLSSIMYDTSKHGGTRINFEEWSFLQFVLQAFRPLADLSAGELEYCLKNITLGDFACLIPYLNDWDTTTSNTLVRNDTGLVHMRELALQYLIKLFILAAQRGDKDVKNYFRINYAPVTKLIYNEENELKNGDNIRLFLTGISRNCFNPDKISWLYLPTEDSEECYDLLFILSSYLFKTVCHNINNASYHEDVVFPIKDVLKKYHTMATKACSAN